LISRRVAKTVTEYRSDTQRRDRQPGIQFALSGVAAHGKQQRVARQERQNNNPRLQKDHHPQQQIRPSALLGDNLAKVLLELPEPLQQVLHAEELTKTKCRDPHADPTRTKRPPARTARGCHLKGPSRKGIVLKPAVPQEP
jgi:hypothetical protein